MRKGDISISTENIFPIIKKWLYSDTDIFLRELVSNGCDAITKHKKLVSIGETETCNDNYYVDIIVNKEERTLTIADNGIGMTEEEVLKYITQIAFSGAEEFIKKYKDDKEGENTIIGHFGLGFYSAFMVADTVDINTLSYAKGAQSVFWSCDGGTSYTLSEGTRTQRGTEVILHISEDNKAFLEEGSLREILSKYCAFLPIPVYLYTAGGDRPSESINDTQPLWLKKPADCTDDEYKAFYKKVFPDFNDPLFYIHLNVEYPFNLKGILYFPRLKHEFDPGEGQIKLYNNQVFVADNIKEVIPEFLLLLKGCIDCPDLPLNVSRSFLQNDGYVKKVSAHITKKVADKLTSLYNTERENYNVYWDDINPFVKYGCLKDDKFYEKVQNIIIYKTTEDRYLSLDEYLSDAEARGHKNEAYYVTDPVQQGQYIEIFKKQGLEALLLPALIDNHFISFTETKRTDIKFKRIDSSIADPLKGEGEGSETLINIFKDAIEDEKLKIEAYPLKADDFPAVLLLDEQSRRMQEMMRMYGNYSSEMFPAEYNLVINTASPVISKLLASDNKERSKVLCRQIYDVARLAQHPLDKESLAEFIKRSGEIITMAL